MTNQLKNIEYYWGLSISFPTFDIHRLDTPGTFLAFSSVLKWVTVYLQSFSNENEFDLKCAGELHFRSDIEEEELMA